MLGKAGDAYIMNNQTWCLTFCSIALCLPCGLRMALCRHRGAPTLTERRRIAAGVTYSKRMISQRLFPHVDYRIPPHVLEGVRRPTSPLLCLAACG